MENPQRKSFSTNLTIVLCTIVIISMNFFVTRQVVRDVQNKIVENEYEKIGGKDNYNILKEIQKEEILNYVNKLKKENPELIYKLRQNAAIREDSAKKMLSWEGLSRMKAGISISGNTGASITVFEYSDFECQYCKDFHNSNALKNISEKDKDVNLAFKNFPIPNHKSSEFLAAYAKCAEKTGGSGAFFPFIDKLFMLDMKDGVLANTGMLERIAKESDLGTQSFETCVSGTGATDDVKNEFKEGVALGINSTPTLIIVNNSSGEYKMLDGIRTEEEIIENISSLKIK